MMNRTCCLAIALLLCALAARAQSFSYLYLQGDKKTPIYVKLEGVMQPRLAKNYAIIPKLAPGPVHITVLFQQNAYPEQEFTILIPGNGARHLLLNQRSGAWSLYDLDQKFYLPAGNTEAQDHLPTAGSGATIASEDPELGNGSPTPPAINNGGNQAGTPDDTTEAEFAIGAQRPDSLPFLNNVVIGRPDTAGMIAGDTAFAPPAGTSTTPAIRNSDCPDAMSTSDFSTLYGKVLDETGDEDRVRKMLDALDRCYTTAQVRALTASLTSDVARLSYLRKVYPRVSDQSDFHHLEDLLHEDQWRQGFTELVGR